MNEFKIDWEAVVKDFYDSIIYGTGERCGNCKYWDKTCNYDGEDLINCFEMRGEIDERSRKTNN